MSSARNELRLRAGEASEALPALILSAERLAATVVPGAHGLRRAGTGEDFWQYRPAHDSDTARSIDWRRSARSDTQFVRDRERQTAQAAWLWSADTPSMRWRGSDMRPAKAERARILALALGLVLLRGGERVGHFGDAARPGRQQGEILAGRLLNGDDAALPDAAYLRPGAVLAVFSDFMTAPEGWERFLAQAAAAGTRGVMMQVLDPDEEDFPYAGAVLFRAPGEGVRHDTRDAAGLRDRYLARLAARRAQLTRAAAAAGWHFGTHRTDASPAQALLWLYSVLES